MPEDEIEKLRKELQDARATIRELARVNARLEEMLDNVRIAIKPK